MSIKKRDREREGEMEESEERPQLVLRGNMFALLSHLLCEEGNEKKMLLVYDLIVMKSCNV